MTAEGVLRSVELARPCDEVGHKSQERSWRARGSGCAVHSTSAFRWLHLRVRGWLQLRRRDMRQLARREEA